MIAENVVGHALVNKIGILHEESIQTWLLPENPKFVWTLSVVFLLLHVFHCFETCLKWITFFIF